MTGRAPRTWLAAAALVVLAALAYAPSFAAPFQFDDEARLFHNAALQQGNLWDALWWLGNSRVVPSLTLVANYRLAGFDPLGYHIVNFAVHLLTTFGVFALALTLCRTPRLRNTWPPQPALVLASAAGVLFACHPLQTQAVTYVIQRYASMAALFYVWAVVAYLRGRLRQRTLEAGSPRPYFAAALALAVCAVLSKENAISLPAAILLAEWVGFGRPRRWRVLIGGGALALAMVVVPIVWKTATWQPAIAGAPVSAQPLFTRMVDALLTPRSSLLRDARPSPIDYLLTEATVVPRYLGLLMLPWGLNVDHDAPIVHAVSVPVLAGFALLAALAGFGVSQLRRRPLVAFGILWFFITLSVESSVIPIDDAMMEHRMYLPMAGLAVSVGWLFAVGFARAPRVALPVGSALAAALIALTFARNVVWLSPLTLWLDAAEKSPDKGRPHTNLGAAYHKSDRLDEAVEQYCRALKIDPHDAIAHDNLELALTTLGRYDNVAPKVVARQPDGSVVLEMEDATAFCPRDS